MISTNDNPNPALVRAHELICMRQALAKLEEAAALIEAAECNLGDMRPLRSPVFGEHMDQTIRTVLNKVIIVSEALKAEFNV